MKKNYLNFVEAIPEADEHLNLFGIPSSSKIDKAIAEAVLKEANTIPKEPNPYAFAADLKIQMDKLKVWVDGLPTSLAAKAVRDELTARYNAYKAAYDAAVADEAAQAAQAKVDAETAAAKAKADAEAKTNTVATGSNAAGGSPDKSKLMKYVLIGGGVILVGAAAYLLIKKKS